MTPEVVREATPVQATPSIVTIDVPTNALPGSVVIDEVLYDPPAPLPDPDGEWLVLRNVGAETITLRGWTVRDGHTFSKLPAIELPAGVRLLVLAAEADGVQGITGTVLRVSLEGRIGNGLRNAGDVVWLVDGAGTQIDGVSWGDDTSAFAPAVPLVEGRSIKRIGTQDTDSAQDWIDFSQEPAEYKQPTATPRIVAEPVTLAPAPSLNDLPDAPQPTLEVGQSPVVAGTSTIVVATVEPMQRMGVVSGTGVGNLVISEVAGNEGWIELYNRGPEVVDLSDWMLGDETSIPGIVLQSAALMPAHSFVVFAVPELNITALQQVITLRRPDGTIVDSVVVGPPISQRSWSRYPVHGGAWYANTPLSKGDFNQPAPAAPDATPAPPATPAPTPMPPVVVQDSLTGMLPNAVSVVFTLIALLVAVVAYLRRR